MLKVYLIRHACSIGNEEGTKMGSDIDLGLSEKGFEEAEKLALGFRGKKIDRIYSSDMKRAMETAEVLSSELGVEIVKDSNLRELKIGDWVDNERDLLKKWVSFYESEKAKGLPKEKIRLPNGENTWDHMKRIRKFIDVIEKLDGEIIVVAHSGTNKVFIGMVEGKDPDDFYSIKQENTCVNELEFNGRVWKVNSVNNTAHLKF